MSNFVIFQGAVLVSGATANFSVNQDTTPSVSSAFWLYWVSETAGMLLKATVFSRETNVTAKVAFNNGSSQQGKALRAAVG